MFNQTGGRATYKAQSSASSGAPSPARTTVPAELLSQRRCLPTKVAQRKVRSSLFVSVNSGPHARRQNAHRSAPLKARAERWRHGRHGRPVTPRPPAFFNARFALLEDAAAGSQDFDHACRHCVINGAAMTYGRAMLSCLWSCRGRASRYSACCKRSSQQMSGRERRLDIGNIDALSQRKYSVL